MSESDPSGYGDSPDTTDPDGAGEAPERSAGTPLTTDDDAQREDTVTRPGNEPD